MMQNQKRELQQLNQLVDLLGKIQNLSSQSANLLDPFQQSVIDSLKKVKQEEAQKKMINQFDLSTLVYNMKIEAKIVNNQFLEFKNQDNNDVFRLIFASFALNLPFDKLQDGPFNQLSLQQKLDYVEMNLFQTEDTKIQIQDKFITSKQAKQVVMQLLKEMIQESKTKPFLPLCYSLVKKFQNQINDLCVVALVRSIIYNAKENDTPPYSQLLNIFSELDSYPPVQDEKEFWWKVCNAFACYVYLGQENKAPQKLGYPAIPDHQLLLPDILLIKENNQLKYLINENFKPVYMNKNRNRNR
ncbi:hypothetical protein ABPG72_004089 [Tetrahymena utriculariae]